MPYQAGDVVYVKSTEEPVTVMDVRPATDDEFDGKKFPQDYKGARTVIVVRRPVMTEAQGIRYAFFDFLEAELEDSASQTNRLYAKMLERAKIVQAEQLVEPSQALQRVLKPH